MPSGLVLASQLPEALNDRLRAHPGVARVLPADPERPWTAATDADVLLVSPSAYWKSGPPRPPGWPGRIRFIQSASAGVDWYPAWLLAAAPMACGRGVAAEPIAEFVMACILDHAKRLGEIRVRRPQDWKRVAPAAVGGSTVALIGLGAIGCRVARLASAFGARVTAVRRSRLPAPGIELAESVADLAQDADHLVLAAPATAATRGIVSKEVFARAKPGLHLINVARADLIDEAALRRALEDGVLSAASLDVAGVEPPPVGHWFYAHDRVRLTPHISWAHPDALRRLGDKVVANLDRLIAGLEPEDLVDPAAGY